MYSTREDRARAEVKATKLTPAQEAQRTHREKCFNAGFDAAIRATTPSEVLKMVHFDHPKYIADRKQKFDEWDVRERAAALLSRT